MEYSEEYSLLSLAWDGASEQCRQPPGSSQVTSSGPWQLALPLDGYYVDVDVDTDFPPEFLSSASGNGTDFSSSDLEWDEAECTEDGHNCEKSRLQKNLKERERVQLKKDSLRKLVSLLRHSEHIAESDKKKRFTEAHTVKMTTRLIQELQRENERLGGGRKTSHGVRVKRCGKKKASNSFIKFSSSLRPIFVEALKTAQAKATDDGSRARGSMGQPAKKPSQKIVQKLAAEVWNRLPQDVKNGGEVRREHIDQLGIVRIANVVLT